MKKFSKSITKEKITKKNDNLFTENIVSLDDKKNQKYFDKLSYEKYLLNLKKESSDLNEQ